MQSPPVYQRLSQEIFTKSPLVYQRLFQHSFIQYFLDISMGLCILPFPDLSTWNCIVTASSNLLLHIRLFRQGVEHLDAGLMPHLVTLAWPCTICLFESPCSSTKLSNHLLVEPQEISHLPFCIHINKALLGILIVPSATDCVGFSIVYEDQGFKGQPLRDHINTYPSIGSNIVSRYGHGSKQCSICPSRFDKFDEPTDHHPDTRSLLQSAVASCPLCT
ncbi:hypothetical protein BGZ57DRAFT_265452 [Hyaloscypha finlandica]|nr:hypothetical protein BGZ57DRAFT_265452 [Hyaloscypha finlandica]